MADAKRDENRVTSLLGVSSTDSLTPVVIEADATTKGINVQIVGDDVGVGVGTEYTEGDTDATITGKVMMWEDAANTIVTVNASKPLPISVATIPSHAVTNAGTFAIQESGAALTALQLIDNAVSGAGFNITQLGGAAVPIGAGLEATALRVTVATDSTGVVSIDDNGGAITVDGTVAVTGTFWQATQPVSLASVPSHAVTNAGTFVVQENGAALTALQLIDNAVSGSGFNITQFGGAAVPIGAGVEATALRVTLATDSTGVVSIDDNGGAITVDGTVAVTNADITSIKTAVEIIDNAISGSEMQVDVVAALPAGTNAIGKLVPPDIDVTAHTNYIRKYYTSAGAATDGIIWSPAAGKRWHITSLYFQTSADATITFEDDKAGGDDPVLKGEYKAGSGVALTFDEKYPFASGEDAADFTVTTSAGNIYVSCVGYEI